MQLLDDLIVTRAGTSALLETNRSSFSFQKAPLFWPLRWVKSPTGALPGSQEKSLRQHSSPNTSGFHLAKHILGIAHGPGGMALSINSYLQNLLTTLSLG